MKSLTILRIPCLALLLTLGCFGARAQETQVQYLSGTGPDHTVDWDFFCTGGRKSGVWTKIGVPSCWELQGFGTYNYGLVDKGVVRSTESGKYRYQFMVPKKWAGMSVRLVFEGSMTDTKASINGQSVGDMHQGSFYRFKYDVSGLLKYGEENLLAVQVDKQSADDSVNWAERKGDFWIFGGIYRPVYLEAMPAAHIERVALDAAADGHFRANVFLKNASLGTVSAQIFDENDQAVGAPFSADVHDSVVLLQTDITRPKLWSPEWPNLYHVVFQLTQNGKVVHEIRQRFGFRTIELRRRDGMYVNGVKIKFRGVNHASFWPTTGRATSREVSIKDVMLMKDMNMNAVRMSHYPPDEHFLDVCDSLGLYVMDELTGWHHWYDTKTGTKLATEMLERDLNHASVVMFSNGNEGGFNFDLDPVFDKLDALQHRPLVHPWAVFRGMDTQHYINYDYGNDAGFQGHEVFFPTEFSHGLYDGGGGAGLYDYWERMWRNPLSAGGFIWVFADEGIVRTDQNGRIDVDKDHAPDGVVGPFREREGSYNAIKEIWCPVHIEHREITPDFDGTFTVENRFSFTNLKDCRFSFKLAQELCSNCPEKMVSLVDDIPSPDIKPGATGLLKLPALEKSSSFDVLYLTATGPDGRELYTWSWPLKCASEAASNISISKSGSAAIVSASSSGCEVKAGKEHYSFDAKGLLTSVKNDKGAIPFGNGPVLCDSGNVAFDTLVYHREADNLVIESKYKKGSDLRSLVWTIYPSGLLKMDVKYYPKQYDDTLIGVSFSYPEASVKSIQWMGDGPYRVWKNRTQGVTLGVWDKKYNNTVTGDPDSSRHLEYPEFKGYYSNFYWMELKTTGQLFRVLCASDDIYLRLFTPRWPARPYNTAPPFPPGDISFMHGIPAIGTKMQKPAVLGPSGQPNMYYDYGKDKGYAKDITLYFDFSGK